MSTWSDKFHNHPFLGVWSQLIELSHDESLVSNLDESSVQDLARLNKVLTYLDGMISKIDPELFPLSLLNTLQQQAQACFNELNAFKGNGNIAHIQNANNHIDSILTTLHQTQASVLAVNKENVGSAIKAYSNTIESYITQLKEQTSEAIEELTESISAINQQIEAEKSKISQLEEEISTVEQTIQQQTSEFNTQFQASEKARTEKFENTHEKYTAKYDELFSDLSERAAKIIEVLVKLQDDASKVYGVTINTLQAGAYSSYANEEKRSANRLRLIASVLMLAGVAFLVVPEIILALGPDKYVFIWEKVLGRLPLSLVVFVPAFYFARESSRHRNNEVTNRRRQHILTTLDPYIELMDSDKAQELKAHVAKTIFSEVKEDGSSSVEAGNIISQLANLAKQIKK